MKPLFTGKETAGKKGLSPITNTYIHYETYLKAFLRRFTSRQHDIEDIAQEAYLKAFRAEQNRDIQHPKTFLFTVAKNIALNELRNTSRRITEYIDDAQEEPEFMMPTTEEEVEALDRLETYCAAVDDLPEQCRRVYLLRKVHGMPQKEIAEKLNITLRSVERHLQKGVIKCRAYMRQQEGSNSNSPTRNSTGSTRQKGTE